MNTLPMGTLLTMGIDVMQPRRLILFSGLVLFPIFYFLKNRKIENSFFVYVLISAIYVSEFPGEQFKPFTRAFEASSGQTICELLIIPFGVLYFRKIIVKFLPYFMILEIISIWTIGHGSMIAPSFDSALLALYLPFAPLWVAIPSLITILMKHGSTAALIVIGECMAYLLSSKKYRSGMFLLSLAIIAGLSAFIHSGQSGSLFDSWERLDAWKRFMGFWFKLPWTDHLFGTGPGTFIWLSMMIDHYRPPIFFFMHSDWLQIVFELGFLGLILSVIVLLKSIRKSLHRPKLLAGVIGSALFCLTYHPLRFLPTIVLFVLIFNDALNNKSDLECSSQWWPFLDRFSKRFVFHKK